MTNVANLPRAPKSHLVPLSSLAVPRGLNPEPVAFQDIATIPVGPFKNSTNSSGNSSSETTMHHQGIQV